MTEVIATTVVAFDINGPANFLAVRSYLDWHWLSPPRICQTLLASLGPWGLSLWPSTMLIYFAEGKSNPQAALI